MFGFAKRLVNRVKNRLFLKPPTYNIDPGYLFMDMYKKFPIYKYSMDINRSDEDEEFDIYEVIFNDLVATGDFEPINYEYNNEGRNAGKPSSEKNGDDIIYVDKFCLAKKDEPVMVYYEYGQLMVFTHLSVEKIDEIVEKYLSKYDQDDEKARCYIVVKNPNIYLESFDINLEGDLDFDLYNAPSRRIRTVYIYYMVKPEPERPPISDISSRSVLRRRGSLSMSLPSCSRTSLIRPSFLSFWTTGDVSISSKTVRVWLLWRTVSGVTVSPTC